MDLPNENEILILRLLPGYGLELVDRSEGKLQMGSVYGQLYRLRDRGWVTSSLMDKLPEAIGPARRRWELTEAGVRAACAYEAAEKVLNGPVRVVHMATDVTTYNNWAKGRRSYCDEGAHDIIADKKWPNEPVSPCDGNMFYLNERPKFAKWCPECIKVWERVHGHIYVEKEFDRTHKPERI
jgi:DNA-binding PadR family transcriptional regulator